MNHRSRSLVFLALTQLEAEALLASNSHTEAGELLEVFRSGHAARAFERADQKIRSALREAGRP